MSYRELTVCDRFQFAHIAEWEESRRLANKRREAFKALDRRR